MGVMHKTNIAPGQMGLGGLTGKQLGRSLTGNVNFSQNSGFVDGRGAWEMDTRIYLETLAVLPEMIPILYLINYPQYKLKKKNSGFGLKLPWTILPFVRVFMILVSC